jgi:hypothetical protein
MSYKIVVARYNENINWLGPEMKNCIIYNKGTKLNLKNEIVLENVGRESETYLNYIIINYYNLPDVVVFTQARIDDHRGSNSINYLLKLKNEALVMGKSYPFIVHYQTMFNTHCWDSKWNYKNNTFYLANNYKDNKPVLFDNWFVKYINPHYPNPIGIYPNGIFAVRKELITQKPVEYYKVLISQVNHHINPAEGHFFERSWYYIFN